MLTLLEPLAGRVCQADGRLAHGLAHLLTFLAATARAAPTGKGQPLQAAFHDLLTSSMRLCEAVRGWVGAALRHASHGKENLCQTMETPDQRRPTCELAWTKQMP